MFPQRALCSDRLDKEVDVALFRVAQVGADAAEFHALHCHAVQTGDVPDERYLQQFGFAEQVTLSAVDIQHADCIEFRFGFDGRREDTDIHAVRGVRQSLHEELVVDFTMDITGVTAVYLQVPHLDAAEIAKGIESVTEMVSYNFV